MFSHCLFDFPYPSVAATGIYSCIRRVKLSRIRKLSSKSIEIPGDAKVMRENGELFLPPVFVPSATVPMQTLGK